MVNYNDQVVSFIGFKVAVMGPFAPVWVIITFMHDLRRQCRTRKTWLKFNHFLIYVFMQELTMEGHEWNNAMRPGLVWYARSVWLLCRMCHIWGWREMFRCRQLVPKCGSLFKRILFVHFFTRWILNSPQRQKCVLKLHWNLNITLFFPVLKLPQRASRLKKNPTWASHGQQPVVLLAAGNMPIHFKCCTVITAVNNLFSFTPSSIILCPFHRKKGILQLFLWRPQTAFWIQTPEYDQLKSCCSAPLVRRGIHQCLVYLLFPHARKGQSLRIILHGPSRTQ